MVNKNDDFYDSDSSLGQFRLNNSNGFLPPSPPDSPVVNSPEKLDSNHVASEETSSMLKSRKKRKATLASYAPDPKRIWSKDDELVILKGIIDYRNETGVDYLSDSRAFFNYIKDDTDAKVSKDQLVNKIRKLKKKFQDNLAKKPCFTNSHDSESFDLSMAIWGKDRAGCVDGNNDKAKGTESKIETGGKESGEIEAVTNAEPGNDDGSAKGDTCDDKLPSENVNKRMKKGIGGKESEEDCVDGDLCALEDALESTMFYHLGTYTQKLMFQKLRSLRANERKELSGEWESLLVQEALLKSKKHAFSAKLANAVLHD